MQPPDPDDPPPPDDADAPADAAALDALLRSVPMLATADALDPSTLDRSALDALPDPGRLVAFHQGRLGPAEVAEVEAELARSSFARAMLAELTAPLGDTVAAHAEQGIPRRGRRLWPIMGGLALAAALMLAVVLNLRAGSSDGPLPPDAYRITAVEGGLSELRSEGGTVFTPERTLTLFTAPTAGDARPAEHAALFVHDDASLRAVEATITPLGGAFRVEAPATQVFPRAGEWIVSVALAAEADALRALNGAAVEGLAEAHPGVRRVEVKLSYREAAP